MALVHSVILESASFPFRVQSQILPIDVTGKESRAYRQPLGVIGVISPWNFPMQLSNRSIGPALALGNGVVVKPGGGYACYWRIADRKDLRKGWATTGSFERTHRGCEGNRRRLYPASDTAPHILYRLN